MFEMTSILIILAYTRELLIQLLVQMWMWLVVSFLYYGFNFSWSHLGENLYTSYSFAALGDIIACLGMGVPIRYLGRRLSMIVFYFIGKFEIEEKK